MIIGNKFFLRKKYITTVFRIFKSLKVRDISTFRDGYYERRPERGAGHGGRLYDHSHHRRPSQGRNKGRHYLQL